MASVPFMKAPDPESAYQVATWLRYFATMIRMTNAFAIGWKGSWFKLIPRWWRSVSSGMFFDGWVDGSRSYSVVSLQLASYPYATGKKLKTAPSRFLAS
jgi:hypothetical protein